MSTELAWAAGFFDGEGNTHTVKRGEGRTARSIRMSVSQCDLSPLERFNAALGGEGVLHGPYPRTGRPIWTLNFNGIDRTTRALEALRPFLCEIKITQAEKAIADYWEAYQPRKKAEHGSNGMYSNHKCRCAECVEAHRVYRRDWERRRAS